MNAAELAPGPEETLDAAGDGEVLVVQRREGYRFNLDALLLAAFALEGREAERPTRVVELGTGCGVVALVLKARRPGWEVTGLERQPSLAALARRNAAGNRLDVRMIEGDLRALPLELGKECADLVVANPPYYGAEEGRRNPDPERAAARHELTATAADVATAARRLLTPDGAVELVYGVGRLPVLLAALQAERLVPTRLRFVHPRSDAAANVVLLEARVNAKRTLVVEAPLVTHGPTGQASPALQALLARGGGGR